MSKISKELLRDYEKERNFSNPDDVLNAMKDMFKDVLQKALEADRGYDKNNLSEILVFVFSPRGKDKHLLTEKKCFILTYI